MYFEYFYARRIPIGKVNVYYTKPKYDGINAARAANKVTFDCQSERSFDISVKFVIL